MKHISLPHTDVLSAVRTSSIAASVGLVGGIALQTVTEDLLMIVPLLIVLPSLNAMAGDYATITTAHIGDPETSRANMRKLFQALAVSVPVSALGAVGLSIFFATLRGYVVDREFLYTYTVFILLSFAVVVAFTVISSILLNKLLIRHRVNSDDILIPVSNVLASVLMLLCVSFAAWRVF